MKHQEKKSKSSPAAISPQRQLSHIDSSEWPSFPVFTAVRVVWCECLHASGDEGLARVIDAFLDNLSGSLTLSAAYRKSDGSLRLLQYLATHEAKAMDQFLRRWEVNAVTGQMAARGDIQSLKWVAEKYLPGEFLTEVVAQASVHGHLDIVKWLWDNHRRTGYWGGIELVGAVHNDHYEVVEWLRAHIVLRPECAQQVIRQAAGSGNLEIVQWLYSSFDLEMVDALQVAALNGHWEVIRWFIDNDKRAGVDVALRNVTIYMSAAEHGDLDMLKFLFEHGMVAEPVPVLQTAAACGHLHLVKWLHEEKGVADAAGGLVLAAENGHLEVLKYLHRKKFNTDAGHSALDAAARSGFLETVEWLHSNTSAECTTQAMDEAAGRGHLEMVKWLHENRMEGCSFLAMHFAAKNGHIETVKWLHTNRNEGCHSLTLKRAAQHDNLEMVKWLHANRHEVFDLEGVMDTAAAHGQLEILQWFHENRDGGCTTAAMDEASAHGHLDVVQWLHEHRSEGCTQLAMDESAKNGLLEVVKWLHLNRSEGCSTMAIDGAAGNSHLHVVKWLRSHRGLRCTPLALEWLFMKPIRLDTAEFLFSEFPECRAFHLGPELEVAWLEVVQWLLERAPSALGGCTLRVKSWNWHVWEWLADKNWMLVNKDGVFSFWSRS